MINAFTKQPLALMVAALFLAPSCSNDAPSQADTVDTTRTAMVVLGEGTAEDTVVKSSVVEIADGRKKELRTVKTDCGEFAYTVDSDDAHPHQEIENAFSAIASVIAQSIKSGNWDTNDSK